MIIKFHLNVETAGAVAVGSSERLCENSFFDHPIHLLDSSKRAMLKIGSLPNFAQTLFTQARDLLRGVVLIGITSPPPEMQAIDTALRPILGRQCSTKTNEVAGNAPQETIPPLR